MLILTDNSSWSTISFVVLKFSFSGLEETKIKVS